MSLLAYLYQFKANLCRFFHLKKTLLAKQQITKYAQEVRVDEKKTLRLRCKKAAQEVQYLGRFSHWHIARAKINREQNSLIYLDVSRRRRKVFEPEIQGQNKVISVIDKAALSNKIANKFP